MSNHDVPGQEMSVLCPMCKLPYGEHTEDCPVLLQEMQQIEEQQKLIELSGETEQSEDKVYTDINPTRKEHTQDNGRLTFILKVYHERPNKPPTMIPVSFSRLINEDEQTYEREAKIAPEWKFLNIGWIEKPSIVVVYNVGDIPILIKSTDYYCCTIPPKEGIPIFNYSDTYRIKALVDETNEALPKEGKATIWAIPS